MKCHIILYPRLAKALCASVIIHLMILYGISWSPVKPARNEAAGLTVSLNAVVKPAEQAVKAADTRQSVEIGASHHAPATEAVISTALETRYFTLAELDQHPAVTQDIADNPPELLGYSQGGEIVLRLWIDETGKVLNVDVVSTGLPQAFIDSARAQFLSAAFIPGRKDGHDVATVMEIVVSYAAVGELPQPLRR